MGRRSGHDRHVLIVLAQVGSFCHIEPVDRATGSAERTDDQQAHAVRQAVARQSSDAMGRATI